jgi:hypothetical protein
MSKEIPIPEISTICETENYIAWRAVEPDGETTYNLQLNNVTINFFQEEWQEFMEFVRILVKPKG